MRKLDCSFVKRRCVFVCLSTQQTALLVDVWTCLVVGDGEMVGFLRASLIPVCRLPVFRSHQAFLLPLATPPRTPSSIQPANQFASQPEFPSPREHGTRRVNSSSRTQAGAWKLGDSENFGHCTSEEAPGRVPDDDPCTTLAGPPANPLRAGPARRKSLVLLGRPKAERNEVCVGPTLPLPIGEPTTALGDGRDRDSVLVLSLLSGCLLGREEERKEMGEGAAEGALAFGCLVSVSSLEHSCMRAVGASSARCWRHTHARVRLCMFAPTRRLLAVWFVVGQRWIRVDCVCWRFGVSQSARVQRRFG
ncbi:uncharacterized protein J3D65DRAFT_96074 [Phyllosticta citribraziliensis]|uniref:Uncharacterized protein n=1 Tax=Phyllosticta citribraziliensis TaxID=989973 RepID=A0ABR1LC22_9PEZI